MRPVRRALRKNLDVVETDSGFLLVPSACREANLCLGHLLEMKDGERGRPRSATARRRANGAKGGRRPRAIGGAAAAGEASAGGASAPLGASDLLPDPAHGGAHAVVEGSLADSQVCFRLLLRVSLRGGPVI